MLAQITLGENHRQLFCPTPLPSGAIASLNIRAAGLSLSNGVIKQLQGPLLLIYPALCSASGPPWCYELQENRTSLHAASTICSQPLRRQTLLPKALPLPGSRGLRDLSLPNMLSLHRPPSSSFSLLPG